ncbi:MAG TPA: amidophosphoribosyltransferase [Clostridiales bacterium]|jgi:amidophosphoribosyltransferase|nr:amidophosphoribosyltransferase [Clostridiales bacterium]
MFGNIHEECGVFGIYGRDTADVASDAYYGLFALQHRGQESCGIAVNDCGLITVYKDVGIVNDVFTKESLASLGTGQMAIGHVRYGTTGGLSRRNAQPLVINHIKGSMALAHNGNLTNAAALRRELELEGSIFHTTSDTEVIAYTITKCRLNTGSIEEALSAAMKRLQGAYSIVLMSPQKLIGARDPLGFRPLSIGLRGDNEYVLASETCALDAVGATFLRDVEPGEIVVIDSGGLRSIKNNCAGGKKALCVFEYIYFSRPDSVVEGTSVHEARRRAGALLALRHPVEADVVIGVPDSGIDAAIGYSQQSGIPYEIGFIKNKYIGRTFIQPDQKEREDRVRIKLNVVGSVVKDKRVVMIDDSIVRGTTSARIVTLLREAGAREIHMRVSAPPFLYPCYFGTDIDSQENLIANRHTVDEIARIIGVDSLGYLSVSDLGSLVSDSCAGLCDACFTGNYAVDVSGVSEKSRFDRKICEHKED